MRKVHASASNTGVGSFQFRYSRAVPESLLSSELLPLVALFQLKNVAGTGTSKGLVRLSGMSTEFYHRTESPAEDAFYIAYDYLDRAGAVSEELPVYVFLAREITRLIDRGVKNKIKLANLAIGAFYDRFEIDEQPG